MAQVLFAAYRIDHPDEVSKNIAAEIAAQGSVFIDAISVPAGVNWGEIFRLYEPEGGMYSPQSYHSFPERFKNNLTFQLIPAQFVSIFAEAAANSGDNEARKFTRTSICDSYVDKIKHANIRLLNEQNYHPFGTICVAKIAASLEATPGAVFPSELVAALRRLVGNTDDALTNRVHTAFLLLKHGIDPLGTD